jgi:ABC-type dipeptide/oligopeptide/nickel transport system permease subunit
MATSARWAEGRWEEARAKADKELTCETRPIGERVDALRSRFTSSLWIGGGLTLLLLTVALLAPTLASYPFDQVVPEARLQAPSLAHPFGTDAFGRDLLSRVVYGARVALTMAGLGVSISAGVGLTLGLLVGYYDGWLDLIASRVIEVWLAFPGLLLALIVVARLGSSLRNAAIALGLVGVPSFYRLARASVLSAREAPYVDAARAVGASDRRIILRHILPNIASPLVVLATMRLGTMVLAAGGLSFIGLGAQPPRPEWGAMLADGRDYMTQAPWLAIYPGLCITLSVVGFNLLGDGLRDLLDPRQSKGHC